jgi:hypothetical protein
MTKSLSLPIHSDTDLLCATFHTSWTHTCRNFVTKLQILQNITNQNVYNFFLNVIVWSKCINVKSFSLISNTSYKRMALHYSPWEMNTRFRQRLRCLKYNYTKF